MVTVPDVVETLRADLEHRIDELARDDRVEACSWGELVRSTRASLDVIERAASNSVVRVRDAQLLEEGERSLAYLAKLNAAVVDMFVGTVGRAQRFKHQSWYSFAVRQHEALIEGFELSALESVKRLNATFYQNQELDAYVNERYQAYLIAANEIRTDRQEWMRPIAREALARIETLSERTENA